jgi:hypothetical protein
VTPRFAGALLALLLAGCTAPPRAPVAPPQPTAQSVQELAAAILGAAKRSDHEPDAKLRAQLSAQASRDADACLAREPQAAACLYTSAVALGLQARAHPTQAGGLLKTMIDRLTAAAAADPTYDEAGPARVKALVLIRAPGWPLGPGDPEAGLNAAQQAVALRPRYPPNLLALAEARAHSGDAAGALESYRQGRALAQSLPSTPERDEWLREADQGLQHQQ